MNRPYVFWHSFVFRKRYFCCSGRIIDMLTNIFWRAMIFIYVVYRYTAKK